MWKIREKLRARDCGAGKTDEGEETPKCQIEIEIDEIKSCYNLC
jgi:hypothetical protein